MTPREVLAECQRLGIVLAPEGDGLRFAPKQKMPAWLLAEVQRRKRELVALLSPPVHVLVVVHPDGYLEVFGNRQRVRARVVNALDVLPGTELVAEECLDAQLPAPYRRLHLPGCLVATGSARNCRSVADELDRLGDLRLLQALEPTQYVTP
jgi:hypothetical protein